LTDSFRVPVFFRDEMVAHVDSFSPSAGKPRLVLTDWQAHGLPVEVRAFEPATAELLALAHERDYAEGVLSGRRANGFGTRDRRVADSLRYTSGAMLAAAREAIANGRAAVAPVAGFHHAGHAFGGAFCTFNGLMVAAIALYANGEARRVAILDLDEHYGNGTDDIIEALDIGYVRHYTSGSEGLTARDAPRFLQELPDLVAGFAECDLLLYQAGADAHVDDPLGGWMTTEQLRERDRIVFEACERLRLPVAWNLAGGYQRDARGGIEPVLQIHRNTMRECVDRHAVEDFPADGLRRAA
jgi:acetoin utilization deacetylase AcuC-like enzyme